MRDLLAVENLRQIFGGRDRTYAVDDVSFRMPNRAGNRQPGGRKRQRQIDNCAYHSGSAAARLRVAYCIDGTDILTQDRGWNLRFRSEVQAVFQDPYSVYNPVYKAERVLEAGHPQVWARQEQVPCAGVDG